MSGRGLGAAARATLAVLVLAAGIFPVARYISSVTAPAAADRTAGYTLVARDGGVFAFGTAGYHGSLAGVASVAEVTDGASSPSGGGYTLLRADGSLQAFGDAATPDQFLVPATEVQTNPMAGLALRRTGTGHWVSRADGGVFALGGAPFYGSLPSVGIRPNTAIVDVVATPSGDGYWLLGGDGGVFAFGDATYKGGLAGQPLRGPVVAMFASPSGAGYTLVASDGGVFTFGDASFHGSLPELLDGRLPAAPVVDGTAVASGYLLTSADGGVFAFGGAPFAGSMADSRLNRPVTAVFAHPQRQAPAVAPSTPAADPSTPAADPSTTVTTIPTSGDRTVLSIETSAPESVFLGEMLRAQVNVRNTGAREATGVEVLITLPDAGTFRSSTPVGTRDGRALKVVVGQIDAGTVKSILVDHEAPDAEAVLELSATAAGANAESATSAARTRVLTRLPSQVPPLDRTTVTNVYSATAFLHQGDNPRQVGVRPGAILPERAAVIRARVLGPDGNPEPGVDVRSPSRPELGRTVTDAHGVALLVVNGGGAVTLEYSKSGLLPVQRTPFVSWQEWVVVDDVRLTALDSASSLVTFGAAEWQHHRATGVNDADGSRSATLLFPAGAEASLVLPDGSEQPATRLTIRATEYTRGRQSEGGEERMPGELPPGVAYTYAAEFSADEAIAAGARHIRFSKPVVSYTENFLNVPVGDGVPGAFYDRDRAAWVPVANGRVIAILARSAGTVEVDTDGDGTADDALAMPLGERAELARLYEPGTTLWRTAIDHFSPWDWNYAIEFPEDAVYPAEEAPAAVEEEPDCKAVPGSEVFCQNQALGERLPLAGTPFQLHYRSDRTFGGTARGRRVHVPLTGSTVPASLKRVEVEVQISGRLFRQTFPAAADQRFTFDWDGLDLFGRRMQGRQVADVSVQYVYRPQLGTPSRFGGPPGDPATRGSRLRISTERAELTTETATQISIGTGWDNDVFGLGGWSFSPLHAYSPITGTLYRGDGEVQSSLGLGVGRVLHRIAGVDEPAPPASERDGLPALQSLVRPLGLAPAPDGSVAFGELCRVKRLGTDGVLRTIIGSPTSTTDCGFAGDGGPGAAAKVNRPQGLVHTADGALVIADRDNHRLRRLDAAGTISTIAGTGVAGATGDGGLAATAQLASPSSPTEAPDGSLYFAQAATATQGGAVIRRIDPSGVITTVVGGGSGSVNTRLIVEGAAVSARAMSMSFVKGVASHRDGSLLFVAIVDASTSAARLMRLLPNGDVTLVRREPLFGDLAVDRNGVAYVAENRHVDAVTEDGIVPIAGWSDDISRPVVPDGSPARTSPMQNFRGLAVDARGDLLIAGAVNGDISINRVHSALPGFNGTDIAVPSPDGRRLHRFSSDGRHLDTVDTLTGAVVTSIGYDLHHRPVTITDGYANVTRIVRDDLGRPTAIVAPGGQRTSLLVDAFGQLRSVRSDAGRETTVTMSPTGLLQGTKDALGGTHAFGYDSLGSLVADRNADGASQSLERMENATGFTITRTSGAGRRSVYALERLPDGSRRRRMTDADGRVTLVTSGADGISTTALPDGTVESVQAQADPRFGSAAPVPAMRRLERPDGRVSTTTATRTVSLDDQNNPLSLQTLREVTDTDGLAEEATYSASTRTFHMRSPAGRVSTTVLDVKGRVVERQAHEGLAPIQFVYDDRGRLVEEGSISGAVSGVAPQRQKYSYDDRNRLVASVDAAGATTAYAYDPDDLLTSITDPTGAATRIERDRLGRITRYVRPNGAAHTLSYDGSGRLTAYDAPGAGGTDTYSYDADGRDASFTPAGRTPTTATTDPATGEVVGSNGPSGAVVLERPPSAAYVTGSARHPADGLGVPVTERYRHVGDLLVGVEREGVAPVSLDFSYDLSGRLNSTRYGISGAGLTVDSAYDADGLLAASGPASFSRSGTGGNISASTIAGHGGSTTFTHDQLGRVRTQQAVLPDGSRHTLEWRRDAVGRITERLETVAGATTTTAYRYDAAGRLTEVDLDGAPSERYAYDANGNRISAASGGVTLTNTYDERDRLSASGSRQFRHDDHGQLVERGADRFSYGNGGELLNATVAGRTVRYRHDAAGRVVARAVGEEITGFVYGDVTEPYRPTALLDPDGGTTLLHYDDDRLVAIQRAGNTYAVVTDSVGSPLAVYDATGAARKRIRYDAFGQTVADSDPSFYLPIGFAGGLTDPLTGLVRFGYRDYDPSTGRWTAKDPLLFAGGQGNLYSYVADDPVNNRDPRGLASDAVCRDTSPTAGGGPGFSPAQPEAATDTVGECSNANYFRELRWQSQRRVDAADRRYKDISRAKMNAGMRGDERELHRLHNEQLRSLRVLRNLNLKHFERFGIPDTADRFQPLDHQAYSTLGCGTKA